MVWKSGDRVVDKETGEEGIVLVHLHKEKFFIGGYTEIDTNGDGKADCYGSHATIKEQWNKVHASGQKDIS